MGVTTGVIIIHVKNILRKMVRHESETFAARGAIRGVRRARRP
jgi:hypothetical protein